MNYLGLDFGLKKIGLAIGDDGGRVAVPFDVVYGGLDEVCQIINQEKIEALVVGLAIPEGVQSDRQFTRTGEFIKSLRERTGLPVSVVDEQFTSTEARRVQKEFGAKASEDALAAMLILQAFFDEGGMK